MFWSGDPVRPFLLLKRGLVEPYSSPKASGIPEGFRAADGSWTGIAARARVLLVNKKQLGDAQPPSSISDLAAPRYKGKTAIANPLFGTTTMHVAALFAVWGSERARTFMKQLKDAGVRFVSSNGEVKRLVVAGEITFGHTDTDDANEALKEGAPVELVYPDQDKLGTLVMPLRSGVATPATVRSVSCIRAMKVDYAKVASEMEGIQPWLREWAGL